MDAIVKECCHIFACFSLLFVQLIDRGKISADEVAAEMGISLDSLQAALVVCGKHIFAYFIVCLFFN